MKRINLELQSEKTVSKKFKLSVEQSIGEIFPFHSDLFESSKKSKKKIPKWLFDLLYCTEHSGVNSIPIGDLLGEWTDEL